MTGGEMSGLKYIWFVISSIYEVNHMIKSFLTILELQTVSSEKCTNITLLNTVVSGLCTFMPEYKDP